MYHARIEALEDRKLFSCNPAFPGGELGPFCANVLDNDAATDDVSRSVVAAPPAITVMPNFGLSAGHTYGPRDPLSYDLKLKDVLVSSYRGLTHVGVDRAMADLGDHQADAILIGVLWP